MNNDEYKSKLTSPFSIDAKIMNLLLLGSPRVGKSALTMRFKDDVFLETYEPTLQNTIRKIYYFNDTKVAIEINDIDGQTEYTIFSYSKFAFGINGYILVYSINDRDSFEKLITINSKLDTLVGKKVPKVVIGNKSDLERKREVTQEEGKAFARKIDSPFIETSAKNKVNVNLMISSILTEVNSVENAFDSSSIQCFNLFKFFIKKEKQIVKIFMNMSITNVVFSLLGLIYGIFIAITLKNKNLISSICIFLYSIWTIIMSGIGIFASKYKKYKMFFLVI